MSLARRLGFSPDKAAILAVELSRGAAPTQTGRWIRSTPPAAGRGAARLRCGGRWAGAPAAVRGL